MGWKVIIVPSARADLESIVRFIARQNSAAAARVGYEYCAVLALGAWFPAGPSGRVSEPGAD